MKNFGISKCSKTNWTNFENATKCPARGRHGQVPPGSDPPRHHIPPVPPPGWPSLPSPAPRPARPQPRSWNKTVGNQKKTIWGPTQVFFWLPPQNQRFFFDFHEIPEFFFELRESFFWVPFSQPHKTFRSQKETQSVRSCHGLCYVASRFAHLF